MSIAKKKKLSSEMTFREVPVTRNQTALLRKYETLKSFEHEKEDLIDSCKEVIFLTNNPIIITRNKCSFLNSDTLKDNESRLKGNINKQDEINNVNFQEKVNFEKHSNEKMNDNLKERSLSNEVRSKNLREPMNSNYTNFNNMNNIDKNYFEKKGNCMEVPKLLPRSLAFDSLNAKLKNFTDSTDKNQLKQYLPSESRHQAIENCNFNITESLNKTYINSNEIKNKTNSHADNVKSLEQTVKILHEKVDPIKFKTNGEQNFNILSNQNQLKTYCQKENENNLKKRDENKTGRPIYSTDRNCVSPSLIIKPYSYCRDGNILEQTRILCKRISDENLKLKMKQNNTVFDNKIQLEENIPKNHITEFRLKEGDNNSNKYEPVNNLEHYNISEIKNEIYCHGDNENMLKQISKIKTRGACMNNTSLNDLQIEMKENVSKDTPYKNYFKKKDQLEKIVNLLSKDKESKQDANFVNIRHERNCSKENQLEKTIKALSKNTPNKNSKITCQQETSDKNANKNAVVYSPSNTLKSTSKFKTARDRVWKSATIKSKRNCYNDLQLRRKNANGSIQKYREAIREPPDDNSIISVVMFPFSYSLRIFVQFCIVMFQTVRNVLSNLF